MAWTERYVSAAGGGAHDGTSEADAWTLAEAIAAPYAAGQRINVKAGTYANTTTDRTFSVAGSTAAPIWWRGYKTTIGDLDDGVTLARSLQDGVNLPLWTFTTGQIVVSGVHHIFSNIDITSQCVTAGGALNATAGNIKLIRCRIENTAANSAGRAFNCASTGGSVLINCRMKATTTAAQCLNFGVQNSVIGCHVIGGDVGIASASSGPTYKTVIEAFGTTGMAFTSGVGVVNNVVDCTIYAAATNGITNTTLYTTGHLTITNSIIGGCTNGVNATAGSTNGITIFRTHFYGCTNNLVNLTELSDVTADLGILTALFDDDIDPFVAKATGDFSLANGAIDIQAGFPGVFEGQTAMVGYPDIGAVQKKAAGGRLLRYPGKGRIRLC